MSYDYGTTYEERAQIAEAELARLRAENDRMRAAMAEAVRDYHGIAVLFSSRFLALAQEPPA